jgi:GNAT superfamily N-acetyltransferase
MSGVTLRAWSAAPDRAAFADVFAELPRHVRREPYRAALLPGAAWKAFLDFPLTREFWVAEKGGRAVGRVGASLSPSYPGTGYLGFFEVDMEDPDRDMVARALIDVANAWLGGCGARKVYGPLDVATWFNYRFRVPADPSADEEAEPAFAWEPVNPPEYVRWFAERGFTEAERYHSLGFRPHDPALVDLIVAATGVAYDQARQRGMTFRALDTTRLDAELSVLYALSMEAFCENFLFEPIPFEAFRALYAAAAAHIDERLTYFVLDPCGREAGFVFAFIDRGYTVVKTIALRPQFRGQKLSTALMHVVFKETAARGLGQAISALVKNGSKGEILATRQENVREWRREYALFEKHLQDGAP